MTSETGRAGQALSLLVTAAVAIGSVVAVYSIFPNRRGHVVTRSIEAHRQASPAYELAGPSDDALAAWAIGVLGDAAPWPRLGATASVVGARSLDVLGRRAAYVRYMVGGVEVSVVVQRAREALPRTTRRVHGGDVAISRRDGPWTVVVVGPTRDEAKWAPAMGVP